MRHIWHNDLPWFFWQTGNRGGICQALCLTGGRDQIWIWPNFYDWMIWRLHCQCQCVWFGSYKQVPWTGWFFLVIIWQDKLYPKYPFLFSSNLNCFEHKILTFLPEIDGLGCKDKRNSRLNWIARRVNKRHLDFTITLFKVVLHSWCTRFKHK